MFSRLTALIVSLIPFGSIVAEDSNSIFIDYSSEAKFDIFYHRVQDDVTSAVFFGVIGAGIEAGIQEDKDRQKRSELLKGNKVPSCDKPFKETLEAKLQDAGYKTETDRKSDVPSKNDLILKIQSSTCGFKIINTESRKVAAFYNFKTFLNKGGQKLEFDESFLFTGETMYSFEELLGKDFELENELDYVLSKAGKRLANKIIYMKGE